MGSTTPSATPRKSSLYRAIESRGVELLSIALVLPRNQVFQSLIAIMVQANNDELTACNRALYTHDPSLKLSWIDEMIVHEAEIASNFHTWYELSRREAIASHPISEQRHAALLKEFVRIGNEIGLWRRSVVSNHKPNS